MENASKALIIAGSILISIVLVSVGVLVVNQLNPGDAAAKMDEQAVRSFNASFDPYMGTNVSGTNVRSLISAVTSSNTTNFDDDSKTITIKITPKSGSATTIDKNTTTADIATARNSIGTGKRYNVSTTATQSSGVISEITITEK